MPWHLIVVTTGVAGVWCEDSRTLRVRLQSAPALYGPRHALRRAAWQVVVSDGSEHRVGAPEVVDGTPTDVLVPVDTPWPPNATVTVTLDDIEDANGVLYDTPAVLSCRSLPEVRPQETTAAGLLPREDLATDPETGGLVIRGGTWQRHFGRAQLVKVIERLVTDREPRGLGFRKGEVVTQSRLSWFRARARQIVAAQEGIEAVRIDVQFVRAQGLLKIRIDVKTPAGWESLELEY